MSMPILNKKLNKYINMISDHELRNSVTMVWSDLLKESSWNNIDDVPCQLDAAKISLVDNTCNVTNYAIHAAQVYQDAYDELQINMDYLIAGCLLHNVSRLKEYHRVLGKIMPTKEGVIYNDQFMGISKALHYHIPTEVIHMILSDTSHTNLVPKTPEALILYFCTRIDMDVRNLRAGLPLRVKDKNYLIKYCD